MASGSATRSPPPSARGIWVGGPVPLGYRSIDKKLEIVPEEAELVRKIFADYLRLGSIGALAASLNAEGIRPKPGDWRTDEQSPPSAIVSARSRIS